ncbi:MAG: ATP-binding protein [Anaerovoracaceae bacterium]|nr:ATP-binding protein [Anaerovoracaceae bacterium]
MTKKIFRSICLVALAVLIASVVLIMGVLYGYFTDMQHDQLRMQTELAAQGVNHEGTAYFDQLSARDYRITLIEPDGRVIYDSEADSGEMENHLEREEVQEALDSGYGESERYSSTLMEKSLYSAMVLDDGSILRMSVSQSGILTLLLGMLQPIIVVLIAAIALSLLLASRLSKRIVKPLNELDLDDPLSNEGYDELSPLLLRVYSQQKQLKKQSAELGQRQDEFAAVTASMSEGLVLLNDKGNILSINPAASRFLDTDQHSVGENILTVNRSLDLQELLSKALNGDQAEKIMDLQEGHYQVIASPVISDNTVSGIALLIFDVTDKENSEQMRREFTANVSHELRTPLHSISGYAELLKNGMVKTADIRPIASKIYDEAQRMVRLVEDIINLSHLDEGAGDMAREKIDLFEAAKAAALSLEPEAESADVSISVTGEPAVIVGIPQLIGGIVYNLCDNAIKYNHKGGSVSVIVRKNDDSAVLTVRDTGIGIPAEDQNRVFERFYRVDKSHSKEVGGTGLGLSIVKHSARIHGARISLESSVGEGTTVTVKFPV